MNNFLQVESGKYVVAVSGGVDSMVLLDLLRQQPGLELVVAHFDHGIRPDSAKDRQLVQKVAKQYGLPFMYGEGKLGADTSEATAREARYAFLKRTQKEQGARALITAHHQDDMLETAIVNMLRGTGRKGLSALRSREDVVRPLLGWTKQKIYDYAAAHNVEWREDVTNTDERYLRNYIRHKILPRFSSEDKKNLLSHINTAGHLNKQIDDLLAPNLSGQLNRRWFVQLPHLVACEVMAAWLRHNGVTSFNRPLIERLVVAAKTKPAGKRADVDAAHMLDIQQNTVQLVKRT